MMICSHCGLRVQDGDRFCKHCGNGLQNPNAILPKEAERSLVPTPARAVGAQKMGRAKNPFRDQLAQLRLQRKDIQMKLRELNNQISGTRSNYFELDSFVQRGPIRRIGRMVEGAQLFGPYQQRKQLQDQLAQLDHQIFALERSQEEWRLQQQA